MPIATARMARASICFERPGTIVRHHDFENFPAGVSPHTTAPFDYLIVALAWLLRLFAPDPLELAGAIVSPLIAVGLAIFLCWWARRMQLRFRFGLLGIFAVSPILAHGMALGRPDHQSLLIALIAVALCAEWLATGREISSRAEAKLQTCPTGWQVVCGIAWALAIWVSLYEPLILFMLVLLAKFFIRLARQGEFVLWRTRRWKWLAFAGLITVALLIERRFPAWPGREFSQALQNWAGTIGELSHVAINSRAWFEWCGWLILLTPLLFWPKQLHRRAPAFLILLLLVTFALTMIQARWAYFFMLIFALLAPEILSAMRKPFIAVAVFLIGLFPIAQAWDTSLSEGAATIRAENRIEQIESRAIAAEIDQPFLAPWWFSPAFSYWSRQPAVAGSSHESISGIKDCALFYATTEPETAAQICRRRHVKWVVSYDADRVAQNAARVLARPIGADALCHVLDRHPSAAPGFLKLVRQTARFKLYRVDGF